MNILVDSLVLVEQGNNFSLTCLAEGGPNNLHMWTMDGQPITHGSQYSISSNSKDTESQSVLSVMKKCVVSVTITIDIT